MPYPGGTQPEQIVSGPDGNLWIGFELHGYIAKFNPTTDAVTEFALPTTNDQAWAITAGADGNIWFTDMNTVAMTFSIGSINPTTDAITMYPLPSGNGAMRGITAGPDGNIWFTAAGAGGMGSIGMINLSTHAISKFALPNSSTPMAITAGPDGNLWFASISGTPIGSINPTTHVITEYATPTPNSYPEGITAGPMATSGSPRSQPARLAR